MNIPIFKLEFDDNFLKEFQEKSIEILTSNRPIAENKYVKEFEDKFSSLVGSRYSVAVTNGTAAIELALKALNVKGKTILLPSNTFFATTVAVTNAGANIELVEAESNYFSLSPEDLEIKIKENINRKNEIGAVIIVHIGGIITNNIEKIVSICSKYKIPLIEDAAHAHCSEINGRKAGTIGQIGCFSFFPTKVMTSGEGGMITTNDEKIADLLRSLKNFGRDNSDPNICINPDGNNYKVTELTGLLGSLECDRVEKRISKRNELVNVYVNRLKKTSYIPVLQDSGKCSYYKMILKTPIEREWLRNYCKKHRITLTGEVYKIPIHQQPLYMEQFRNQTFKETDNIAAHHICPPLYPELTVDEINYICDVLVEAEKEYEK